MESNLKFIETWEVAQFKAQQGVEKLEVKQNHHTGKVFFVYGLETGPSSISGEKGEHLHWLCFRLIRDSQDRQEALGLSACFFMFR